MSTIGCDSGAAGPKRRKRRGTRERSRARKRHRKMRKSIEGICKHEWFNDWMASWQEGRPLWRIRNSAKRTSPSPHPSSAQRTRQTRCKLIHCSQFLISLNSPSHSRLIHASARLCRTAVCIHQTHSLLRHRFGQKPTAIYSTRKFDLKIDKILGFQTVKTEKTKRKVAVSFSIISRLSF